MIYQSHSPDGTRLFGNGSLSAESVSPIAVHLRHKTNKKKRVEQKKVETHRITDLREIGASKRLLAMAGFVA